MEATASSYLSSAPSLEAYKEASHPLNQLSCLEIERAAAVCRAHALAHHDLGCLRFNTIMLSEPLKHELLAFQAGRGPLPARQAQCVIILPQRKYAVEAIVRLGKSAAKDAMMEWNEIHNAQPMLTPCDAELAEQIVRKDPGMAKLLCERYGITNMNLVAVDGWAVHGEPTEVHHRRLVQGIMYLKLSPEDNEYSHPIDVVPLIDINTHEIVHLDMHAQPSPIPLAPHNFHRDLQPVPVRDTLKPLDIVQPEGPSFEVDGTHVKWQNWDFRIGFNAREGLTLHNVGFMDGGRLRPILHRISLVEMAVPYGQPNSPYNRKCAFDIGEYGFGLCANSLELGCDCLGHIRYFDAILNNAAGQGVVRRKAVCMHEEDAGTMWKHFDARTNHAEVRRARRLVISQISTFSNYEYLLYIYLYQDGSITYELKLTGILSTSITPPGLQAQQVQPAGGPPGAGHRAPALLQLQDRPRRRRRERGQGPARQRGESRAPRSPRACVAPGVVRCARRGPSLRAVEATLTPSMENPALNGFYMGETVLRSTDEAQRHHNFSTPHASGSECRSHGCGLWRSAADGGRIKNPFSINPVTQLPVAYKLIPAPSPRMMALPGSLVAARALFATKHLWVTPFHNNQKYPAGEHIVQSEKCKGLGEWTKENLPLTDGADPEFPVMPVEVTSFRLMPAGFFSQNPTLDLPYERSVTSREQVGNTAAGVVSACCMAKL
ncbi:MAG: hypothetical protein WDW36_005411 [Sanguina aurantia]